MSILLDMMDMSTYQIHRAAAYIVAHHAHIPYRAAAERFGVKYARQLIEAIHLEPQPTSEDSQEASDSS